MGRRTLLPNRDTVHATNSLRPRHRPTRRTRTHFTPHHRRAPTSHRARHVRARQTLHPDTARHVRHRHYRQHQLRHRTGSRPRPLRRLREQRSPTTRHDRRHPLPHRSPHRSTRTTLHPSHRRSLGRHPTRATYRHVCQSPAGRRSAGGMDTLLAADQACMMP